MNELDFLSEILATRKILWVWRKTCAMQSYPSSAGSLPPMVHEQERGYTGERDEVQAPKATAPRVVSPVLLIQVWHWLLGFGVAPVTSPLCCCTLHSKTNTLQYDNLLPDHEGGLTGDHLVKAIKWNERIFLHSGTLQTAEREADSTLTEMKLGQDTNDI